MPLPLADRRIVVTRRPEQAATLTDALRALGAAVTEVPLIEVAPPDDAAPLRQAVTTLSHYDWIVLTSGNAVEAVAAALEREGCALPTRTRIATVGPATTRAVRERLQATVSLEPARDFQAEGLLQAFGAVDLGGRHVLVPVSERARDVLPDGLRARGAVVDVVSAYRTVTPVDAAPALEQAIADGADLVTLASPSAVDGFVAALGERARALGVAVIGPVTEQAARARGLDVQATASPATAEGLVAAIRRRYEPDR